MEETMASNMVTDADGNREEVKSSDALAKALTSTLTTVLKDFDTRAEHTLQSQDQLASAIDRLTGGQLLFNLRLAFDACSIFAEILLGNKEDRFD